MNKKHWSCKRARSGCTRVERREHILGSFVCRGWIHHPVDLWFKAEKQQLLWSGYGSKLCIARWNINITQLTVTLYWLITAFTSLIALFSCGVNIETYMWISVYFWTWNYSYKIIALNFVQPWLTTTKLFDLKWNLTQIFIKYIITSYNNFLQKSTMKGLLFKVYLLRNIKTQAIG